MYILYHGHFFLSTVFFFHERCAENSRSTLVLTFYPRVLPTRRPRRRASSLRRSSSRHSNKSSSRCEWLICWSVSWLIINSWLTHSLSHGPYLARSLSTALLFFVRPPELESQSSPINSNNACLQTLSQCLRAEFVFVSSISFCFVFETFNHLFFF